MQIDDWIPERHRPFWKIASDSLRSIRRRFLETRGFTQVTRGDQTEFGMWLNEIERLVRRLIIAAALTYTVPREMLVRARPAQSTGPNAPDAAKTATRKAPQPPNPSDVRKPLKVGFWVMRSSKRDRASGYRLRFGLLAMPKPTPDPHVLLVARLDAVASAMARAGDLSRRLATRFARDTADAPRAVTDWIVDDKYQAPLIFLPELDQRTDTLLPNELARFVYRNPRPG